MLVGSESRQIDNILRHLQEARELLESRDVKEAVLRIHRAQGRLRLLRNQVSSGYHENPYTPFRVIGEIGDDVHSVAYRHAKDGKLYKHDFEPGSAKVIAVERHGKRELLVTGDVPLWDDF